MAARAQPGLTAVARPRTSALQFTHPERHPDTALTDVLMPGMDGTRPPGMSSSPVGFPGVDATRCALHRYVCGTLRTGAGGFPFAGACPDELVAGIRAVTGGKAAVAPAVPRCAAPPAGNPHRVDHLARGRLRTTSDRPDQLDRRECDVLCRRRCRCRRPAWIDVRPTTRDRPGRPLTAPAPRVDAPSYRGTTRHRRIRSRGADDMRVFPPSLTAGSHKTSSPP